LDVAPCVEPLATPTPSSPAPTSTSTLVSTATPTGTGTNTTTARPSTSATPSATLAPTVTPTTVNTCTPSPTPSRRPTPTTSESAIPGTETATPRQMDALRGGCAMDTRSEPSPALDLVLFPLLYFVLRSQAFRLLLFAAVLTATAQAQSQPD